MIQLPASRSTRWISLGLCASILGIGLFVAFPRNSKEAHSTEPRVSQRSAASESNVNETADSINAPSQPNADTASTKLTATPPQEPQHIIPVTAIDKDLPRDFLDRIVFKNAVAFTLPDGSEAKGGVEMIQRDADGILFVQGRLTHPAPGFYFLQRQTVTGVAGPLVGHIRFDGKEDAWKAEPAGPQGAARLVARKLDDIICVNYAKMPKIEEMDVENAPQTHPTNIPIPSYQTVIPLQSLPGAIGVIYLDFDGETGPFTGWGDFIAAPSGANNTQIFDVWKMVSEDFQGFNLNITTDRKIFENAPQGRRQRVIITPTTDAAPGAGGVAYLGSFNSSGDTPCWAFYAIGKSACEVISHEVGHTLNLSHDGRISPSESYYGGHGSGVTGWAPIMGVGYYQNLSQWSKGQYLSANQTQDDLSIIVNNNNVDYRTDDTGDILATARYLEIAANNSVANEGIIETTGDIDSFRFVSSGGNATLNVNPVSLNPNLDIQAEIVDAATNIVVVTNNGDLVLNATVTANLAAGEYLLRIRGVGRGDPLGDGYTNYASLGSYLITGSVVGGHKPERFSIAENTANGSAVGAVVPRNSHGANPLSYAIASGNTNGAFAIDVATGAITIANSVAINYEALSLRWDDPATFELFVSITDATDPLLNENLRTVVSVTNVNEVPVITGGVAPVILEHSLVGTNIVRVTASDPDRFDLAGFTITAGNNGNAFAINLITGELTVATDIDVAADTVFNLTVTASDQGAPILTSSVVVTVTVVNITGAYNPGRIVRTFFENISGNTVANLTSNANFPNNPGSEEFLTAFDGQSHGDNFGSTIRGYVIPAVSGTYQFWIASDDASELRLGTNATPASATVKATVAGYTNQYQWTKYSSQQSASISLTAGVPYYIEARHKEGGGGDHLAVAWTGPGITRQVIPGLYLAPFYQNYPPKTNAAVYSIRENAVPGQSLGAFTSSDVNGQDTFSYAITAGNTGGVFGINAATGNLMVAQSGLLNVSTTPTYTLTIQSTDNGTPALSGSGTITVNVLAAAGINETGIVQEIWTGISGTAVANLTGGNPNYPFKPTLRRALTSFDTGSSYADNFGSRIRVKFTPPSTDSYRFYVASDDASSLLFSTNATGGGAVQIASVSAWTNPYEWTKNASQTSVVKSLVAGQAVYLETLQKEGGGGDHVNVAYTNTTVTTPTIIPGSMLQPFDINAAPVFAPTAYAFNVNAASATTGMTLGTVTATEPNGEALVYAILSGNSQGAFAVNSSTGAITVANPAGLSNGNANLQVAAQDGGLGGIYPFRSTTATVVVSVTASNTAPSFVANPLVKQGASKGIAYNQSLVGSATDVNPGDTLTFAKVSGPSWLVVAANGALTGTPGVGSDGLNVFVVRVTDSSGIFADGTLHITVAAPFAVWVGGPFQGTLNDTNPALDFDDGGLATGIEWVTGGDPTKGSDDAGFAPTFDNTTDPNKFLFVFRRSTAAHTDANTAIAVEYGSSLTGWTTAAHQGVGASQITINAIPDGSGFSVVTVAIPRTLAAGNKLLARLKVTVSQP